jgi:hypothetical protein
LALRFEISPSTFDFRVYDSEKSDMTYIATATIRTCGEIGWVSQISNPVFFDVILENLDVILDMLHITSLEGAMSPIMARSLRMKVKNRGQLTIHSPHKYDGRLLPWVSLTKLKKEPFNDENARGNQLPLE